MGIPDIVPRADKSWRLLLTLFLLIKFRGLINTVFARKTIVPTVEGRISGRNQIKISYIVSPSCLMKDKRRLFLSRIRRFRTGEFGNSSPKCIHFRQKPPSNRTSMINSPTLMSKQPRDYFRQLRPTDVIRLQRVGEET